MNEWDLSAGHQKELLLAQECMMHIFFSVLVLISITRGKCIYLDWSQRFPCFIHSFFFIGTEWHVHHLLVMLGIAMRLKGWSSKPQEECAKEKTMFVIIAMPPAINMYSLVCWLLICNHRRVPAIFSNHWMHHGSHFQWACRRRDHYHWDN